jgi:regulator of sigma E protease
MSILLFIAILLVLVLVHEFGHFVVAKLAKIRVDEFAFGFPPRLFSIKKGETTYAFNLLPLGGYVKIYGEDPTTVGEDSARSFAHQHRLIQAAVIVAGVLMNIVLAWLLISSTLAIGIAAPVDNDEGFPVTNARLMITDVSKKGPADISGITSGDVLISVSDGRDTVSASSPEAVSAFIGPREGKPITVNYERGGKSETATMLPVSGISQKGAAIGIYMDMVGILKLPIDQALYHGGVKTWQYTKLTATGLATFFREVFTGHANFEEVTGPVGIVKAVGAASQVGFVNVLLFTALISINLAIINIIPFPALDGGRLLFIVIEGIIRRPIPAQFTNYVNVGGFALLMLLMILVTYHDIVKLF